MIFYCLCQFSSEPYTLLEMESLLLAQETQIEYLDSHPTPDILSLATQSNSHKKFPYSGSSTSFSSHSNFPASELQCQVCGKFGHKNLKCWHRFNSFFQGL
ncbi:Zinc finger, CCHC-type [Parasponia andersonii]|uniref:Zinc finger, CCHC-type n=1 Tax=Parasponia andersonii TaxID=3476 RepID=A0A2P5BDU4_PARAD|nr:Zinc finger, CCHC-type [Parasponia andersonii]